MTIEIHTPELEAMIMQRMQKRRISQRRRGSAAGVEIVATHGGEARKNG